MDSNAGDPRLRPKRGRLSSPTSSAVRIVLVYAVAAVVWITFSDVVSRTVTVDPDLLTAVSIAKGAFFVLVTSALLFVQIRGNLARLQESGDRLRDSERRLKRVFDVTPVPMAMTDTEGNITLTNAAFVALLGYTQEDIPTLSTWWQAAYPDAAYRQYVVDGWKAEVQRSRRDGDAFSPTEVRIRCKDGGERFMLVGSASLGTTSSERVVVLFDLTEREKSEQAVLQSNERLAKSLKSVIGLIGKVVETRDPYTQGHEEGVARIGRLIAEEMGLTAGEIDGIEVAGLVHDVGKLGVPAELLTKPGKLTSAEFGLIKGHSQFGYDILKDIDFEGPVAQTVLQHHERMDGSGYPCGTPGKDISTAARVLMVADVIEAMAAHRPYRPALGIDAAMAEIVSHPEKFDLQVTQACERLYDAGRLDV